MWQDFFSPDRQTDDCLTPLRAWGKYAHVITCSFAYLKVSVNNRNGEVECFLQESEPQVHLY